MASQRRTMQKLAKGAGVVPANLLLLVSVCLIGALSGAGMVSASAIPAASFPSNGNGIANSASADVGGHHRRPSCVAVHPLLKQRGVDPIDMPIDPIPEDGSGEDLPVVGTVTNATTARCCLPQPEP
uniref:Uncharacterized protein n=1 Tax=Anopheles melas TaxID=34690 RepID=A0A182TSV7_9DIPT